MEQPKLSEQAEQRIEYFRNGCDKDGFEISNHAHLKFAYGYTCLAIRRDLGILAEDYINKNIDPIFRVLAMKFTREG